MNNRLYYNDNLKKQNSLNTLHNGVCLTTYLKLKALMK